MFLYLIYISTNLKNVRFFLKLNIEIFQVEKVENNTGMLWEIQQGYTSASVSSVEINITPSESVTVNSFSTF